MKIKEGLTISTQDFWYDLTDGGYLKPEDICENQEDADAVNAAILVLEKFRASCDEQIEDFLQ